MKPSERIEEIASHKISWAKSEPGADWPFMTDHEKELFVLEAQIRAIKEYLDEQHEAHKDDIQITQGR